MLHFGPRVVRSGLSLGSGVRFRARAPGNESHEGLRVRKCFRSARAQETDANARAQFNDVIMTESLLGEGPRMMPGWYGKQAR